jgi:hypothetical protein
MTRLVAGSPARLPVAFTFAIALGSTALLACDKLGHRTGPGPAPVASVVAPKAMQALPLAPRARRAAIANGYRLGPDRRFVRAAAHLASLLGAPAPGDAPFVGLPELADFPLLYEKIMGYARTLPIAKLGVSGAAAVAPAEPLIFDADATRALATAQGAWAKGETTRPNLALTSRAVVSLLFQSVDSLGVADEVAARAIALMALSDLTQAGASDADRALLAEALGYRAAAVNLASSLPKASALRAYVDVDDAALRPLARAANASQATRYLWLRRSAEAIGSETPRIYARALFGARVLRAPVLDALLTQSSLEEASLLELGPSFALVPLGEAAGDPGAIAAAHEMATAADADDPRTLERITTALAVPRGRELPTFEAWSSKLADPGPLVSADVMRAFYRSLLFTAIGEAFDLELDLYSRPSEARKLYDALQPGAEPASKDLQTWLGTRVQVAEKGASPNLLPGMAAFPALGGTARIRLFRSKKRGADWGDVEVSRGARLLAGSLDARPAHRASLAVAAHDAMDLAESRRLLDSALAVAPYARPWVEQWGLSTRRDPTALRRASVDTHFSASRRAAILAVAIGLAPDDPSLRATIAPLLLELPKSLDVRRPLAEALVDHGHMAEGRAILEPWLAKYADATLRTVGARVVVARSLQLEGRLNDARAAIGTAGASWQFDAMNRTALIEAQLGHVHEAETWAARVVERYPGSHAGAALALTRFIAGDDSGAIGAIVQHHVSYSDSRWRIAREFAPILVKATPARIDAAIAALAKMDFTHARGFAAELQHAGRADLALRILTGLHARGTGQLSIDVEAYKTKRALEGEGAALGWLERRVPAPQRDVLSMFAFSEDTPEVLWKLVPEKPDHGRDSEFTWLMRAATVIAHGKQAEPHYAAVLAYFKDAKATHYAQLGKYLLGLADEASDEPFIKDASDACEAAFYIAHKADAEGRLDDAAAYYRVSVEAGTPQEGEYRWSYNRLAAMRDGVREP